MRFRCLYKLGVPDPRAAGGFPLRRNNVPGFSILSSLGIVQIVEIRVYMAWGTCRKNTPRQKVINLIVTETSRSLTASQLVNPTMN